MKVFFVSRHPGAIEWVKSLDIHIDCYVEHLSILEVTSGDIVIGTLPVQLIDELIAKGARVFLLTLSLTQDLRGKELSAKEMTILNSNFREVLVSLAEPVSLNCLKHITGNQNVG